MEPEKCMGWLGACSAAGAQQQMRGVPQGGPHFVSNPADTHLLRTAGQGQSKKKKAVGEPPQELQSSPGRLSVEKKKTSHTHTHTHTLCWRTRGRTTSVRTKSERRRHSTGHGNKFIKPLKRKRLAHTHTHTHARTHARSVRVTRGPIPLGAQRQ